MPAERRLRVTAQTKVYEGNGTTGPYTIYEVEAEDEHGEAVTQQLSTFDLLPIDKLMTYEVTGPKKTKKGQVYTLKLPKGQRDAGVNALVEDLRLELDNLSMKVGRLEERVDELEGGGSARVGSGASRGGRRAPAAPSDDDIPF